MRIILLIPILALATVAFAKPELKYPSGNADIDRVRIEVMESPTTPENYEERILIYNVWLSALQQLGADTHALFEVDRDYYAQESTVFKRTGQRKKAAIDEICPLLDRIYPVIEEVARKLHEEGPIFTPFTGDPETAPTGGDMDADWPFFQGNNHNSGSTSAPGPKTGELAWKFPVGLGWYARPAIEDGRVYVGSPGMHTTSFCLDLETGEEIWQSTQTHERVGVYKYPAIASSPAIQKDHVIYREINSHGGNEGQARNIIYVDKKTGETVKRSYAGHIDYRTQVAPVSTNGKFVVYPFGIHDIYSTPAICQKLNRLICASADNERIYWDNNIGEIDVLAEPVLSEDHVFQGTSEGYLYAMKLMPDREQISWQFNADGAINSSVARDGKGALYFGSNGGVIYALNEEDGSVIWETRVDSVEAGARKHFTVPLIDGDAIYVGAANKLLYQLDAKTGEIEWQTELTDWVRAKPAKTSAGLLVGTVDGNLSLVGFDGSTKWSKKVSTHQIYADLVAAGDSVLVADSDLWLSRIGVDGEVIWKHSLLNAYIDESGRRILTDTLSGGTYYQSKPTAAEGKVYFGNPGGFLFCVDADTGEEYWKFEMGAAISVAPAIADGKVFAGQQGGERFFYCVDAETGELIWKQTLPGGWVWGSPAVDDGLVFIPTVSGYAVCLDAETGFMRWMYPTAKSLPAEPAVDGDIVYFGSWSHTLYAFNKFTGEIIWKQSGIGLDSGTLLINDGKIYVPNHQNMFMSLDAKTGEIISTGNHNAEAKGGFRNFNATPAFADGKAFFTARSGYGLGGIPLATRIYCADPETAEILWSFPDGGGVSAPAVAHGRVYIGSGNTPFFYCLDAETGEPHWIYELGNRVEEATLCIYRDKVYVLASDGFVHAIK